MAKHKSGELHCPATALIQMRPLSKMPSLFDRSRWLEMKHKHKIFCLYRYDCGTGMGTVQSHVAVKIGEWNILKILRQDSEATLWLNDAEPVKGSSPVS